MSFHIFLNLMSEMVVLCTPYSSAKSFPSAPCLSFSRICKTDSFVNVADGLRFLAARISSVVGQPCLP